MRRITGQLLLLVTALLLAACGAAQTSTGGAGTGPTNSTMSGMDHSAMATAMPNQTADAGGMPGMDDGSTPMGNSDAPYDARFIDSMIMHHQGAIDMANQALEEAERPEITALANEIISAQEAEIAQLRDWRAQWYPDLPDTGGMDMSMGDMMVSADTSKPFDQRFIEAMIVHHQGAIDMAKDAQQNAERAELRTLAQDIITAQEGEVTQMQQWLKDWYS